MLINCSNDACPLRHECKRFLDKPERHQKVQRFTLWNGECDKFFPVEENTEDILEQDNEAKREMFREMTAR